MNWIQVEQYLRTDDRCIVPIGSTEQHAYLSLATDNILAEKISIDAAEPSGVPVIPVLNFGHTPLFMHYPGTISLSVESLWNIVKDILNSLTHHGFKRILIVNGHGGNMFLTDYIEEWLGDKPAVRIKFHNWWRAPETWKIVNGIDPVASHASWMENFKWTRLENVKLPDDQKPMVNLKVLKESTPGEARTLLGDGNYGGLYQRSDEEMQLLWETAVDETRNLLEKSW